MKKITSILLAIVAVLALSTSVSASWGAVQKTLLYEDIKITLDGQAITPKDANGNEVEPFTIDGTTYLPVRAISNALGLDVDWDESTSTVILERAVADRPIYITRTGKHYHYDNTCNGGTYWEVPYETAIGFGLTPCDKCVLTLDHPNG